MDTLLNGTNLGKGLHLAHLNVRSLLGGNKSDMLKKQIADSDFDVLTVSETWLNGAVPDSLIQVPNFCTTRLDRGWAEEGQMHSKKGGGLVCYIRESLNYSDTKYGELNMSSRDLEMQWLLLSLPKVRPIVIVNVYRPPQGDYKKCCTLLTEAFMKADLKDNVDIFLMGDFNINARDGGSPSWKELNFTSGVLGLKQLINSPTRVSYRNNAVTETTIDLIFSNSDFVKSAGVLDLNLSDHMAVMVTRKKLAVKQEKIEFKGRSYRNYDREIFQGALLNRDWGNFMNERDPNVLWEQMQSIMEEEIDLMCPIKSFKVKKSREPWITNEAIEAIRDKDRALRKAKKSGKEEDWAVARRERNRIGRELELLRSDFLKAQQEEYKSDPKNFWKTIQSIIPNKKARKGGIQLKDHRTGLDIEKEQVPSFINEFFTNIGPNLAREHNERWIYFGKSNPHELAQCVTGDDEVKRICREINTMTSSGFDRLSSRVCKDAFLVLSDKLAHIFNCSLEAAIFPGVWKSAKIVPIYKGGARDEVGNYRPVSLLPLPGKLLERIVHNRISGFLEEHNFLSEHQGGFRKGFSTTATIADLTDDLFYNINQGLTTLAAFIDLKKAFDTVNTKILLKKLERAGIRGMTLKWCSDYLWGRSQCTTANGQISDRLPVTCGVPQGSVLGPLFFLVYVNDLQDALGDCKVKLYADDTVLYQAGVSSQQAEGLVQNSIDKFAKWCAGNALTINVKKTKLMSFGSRSNVKKSRKAEVHLNGEKLQMVPSYKYLGITLDPTLSYGQHVASTIKCVQHKISLLGKIKRYLNNDVALKIYKSMILPYIDYADVIYSKARVGDLDKLQRLQNRCLKLCQGRDRYFNTDRLHQGAKTPFLSDRRTAHTLNFMYMRKDKKPGLLNKREIRTRANDAPLFETGVPRCEAFKRRVGYYGALKWNQLDPAVRNTPTYIRFKEIQKERMLSPLALIH